MARQNRKSTSRKKPVLKRPVRHAAKTGGKGKKPLLVHSRHSFRLLPHAHTSYPLLVMLLLFVGLFAGGLEAWSLGDAYTVHAKIPAPPLTQPAVITAPAAGTHFTATPIAVSGTCPNDSYVEVFRNGTFSGVVLCQADGTFSLQSDLFRGQNDLTAQDYNITDDPGPTSAAVTVYYDSPQPTPPPTPSSGQESSAAGSHSGSGAPYQPPLLALGSDFLYRGFYAGHVNSWQFAISGGQPPYAISVDWGDGKRDLVSQGTAGTFTVGHTYAHAGSYQNSYPIKVSASDAGGGHAYLQLVAIVTDPGGPGGLAGRPSGTPPAAPAAAPSATSPLAAKLTALMHKLLPVYLISILMVLSFWLGERREVELYRLHHHLRRKRPRHA